MSAPLWTGKEIAAAGGRFAPPSAEKAFTATGVSIDSRTLKPGDLFVALRSARDGHEFVSGALQAGAAGALVDTPPTEDVAGPLIYFDDTLNGLERLAAAARNRSSAKRIAVTGSVGKTSTKEALRLALAASGRVHASEASYNNLWGVPLTLARMPREAEFGVFEIGMNHAGEITPLSKLVEPHAAIITTVEPVHLEFFDSVEEIAEAKAEIFAGLRPGGTAILNLDNPHYARLALRAEQAGIQNILTFGEAPQARVHLAAIDLGAEGSNVVAEVAGTRVEYYLASPGRHAARNSLAVLAGVLALGGNVKAAAETFNALTPVAGRGARTVIELKEGGRITLIDESYNANPASMRAAIANLALAGAGARRFAVLGDMLELGASSPELHAGLAESLRMAKVDRVFLCGAMMKHLADAVAPALACTYARTSEELADAVAAALAAGDVVMVKGSLGARMKAVVDRVRACGATELSQKTG